MARRKDEIYIRTESLSRILQPMVRELDIEREEWVRSGQSNEHQEFHKVKGRIEPVGGIQYLANQIGRSARTVRMVVYAERPIVSLTLADAWLTALGLPHKVHELEIYTEE